MRRKRVVATWGHVRQIEAWMREWQRLTPEQKVQAEYNARRRARRAKMDGLATDSMLSTAKDVV